MKKVNIFTGTNKAVHFNRQMAFASIMLYLPLASMMWWNDTLGKVSNLFKIGNALYELFFSVFIIIVIDKLCKTRKSIEGIEFNDTFFSTWGYFWRAVLTVTCAAIVYAGLVQLIPNAYIFPNGLEITPLTTLTSLPTNCLLVILCVWILFSRDRKGQIAWAINAIRL